MTESYIIELERLRALLVSILTSKGKTVASDATLQSLIPMVSTVGVNNIMTAYLANTPFELIDTDGEIERINGTVFYNKAITKAVLPKAISLSDESFRRSQITSAVIGTETDDAISLAYRAFQSCIQLTSFEGGNVSYADDTFEGCTSLKIAKFKSFTSNKSSTFNYCTSLRIVDFGNTPLLNNGQILTNCTGFKAAVIRTNSVIPLAGTNPFLWLKNNVTGWYIYVPDNLVEDYKVATNWSTFADYFKPLSEYDEETILNGEVTV